MITEKRFQFELPISEWSEKTKAYHHAIDLLIEGEGRWHEEGDIQDSDTLVSYYDVKVSFDYVKVKIDFCVDKHELDKAIKQHLLGVFSKNHEALLIEKGEIDLVK
jgi:hypothetical protein